MGKKLFGILATGAIALAFGYGCSSSENSTPPATTTEAGAEGGNPVDSGGGKPDATPKDTGGATDSGGESCVPGDVSGYTPEFRPPTALHQNACSASQVEMFIKCNYLDASQAPQGCDTFLADTANANCEKCIFTDDTAAKLGPVIDHANNTSDPNVAGCITALEGDTAGTGCGAKVQALDGCLTAACGDNCSGADEDTFNKCLDDSASSVCKTFNESAACGDTFDGGSVDCSAGQDFVETAINLGKIFCTNGSASTDASTDGG